MSCNQWSGNPNAVVTQHSLLKNAKTVLEGLPTTAGAEEGAEGEWSSLGRKFACLRVAAMSANTVQHQMHAS